MSEPTATIGVPLCCCTHGPELSGLEATLAKLDSRVVVRVDRASRTLHASIPTGIASEQVLSVIKAGGFLCDCRPVNRFSDAAR